MTDGQAGLQYFPGLLKRALLDRSWERRKIESRGGEIVTHATFLDFVTYHPYQGLGADIRTLENLCRDDKEVLALIDKELGRGPGAPVGNQNAAKREEAGTNGKTTLDNVQDCFATPQAPTGNSSARALRRLRTAAEKPDAVPLVKETYERVLRNEIKPNRGLIVAGLKKEPTKYHLARLAVQKLTKKEWARLVKEMEAT